MNKIISLLLSLVISLLGALVVPPPPAIAFELNCNGLAVTWSIELPDLVLNYESNCNYYYISEQLPPGNALHMSVALDGAYFGANPSFGDIFIGPNAIDPFPGGDAYCGGVACKTGLATTATVEIPPTSGYQEIRAVVIAEDGDRGKHLIAIYVHIFKSKEIQANPEKKGGPGENGHTEFEGPCQPRGYGLTGYSVNTSTLNLVVQDTDFAYDGLGPAVSLTRTWNADPSLVGMFGRGWNFTYESTLLKKCNGARLNKGGGQGLLYLADLCPASGSLAYPVEATPPTGTFDRLTYEEGDYWLLEEKETRLTYRYELKADQEYRLVSITDPNGNALQIAYNGDGTLHTVTDAAGRATHFDYDADRRCTAMTVADGKTTRYAYDANGNMIANTDLLGTPITYGYDAAHYLTSLSYAGKTTQFTYDTSGGWKHIATVVDVQGNTKRYTADSSGGSTSATDPAGNVTVYYNQNGPTSMVTHPLGHTTYRTYAGGLLTAVTDGNGNVTAMEYDANGNLIKFTDPLGGVTTHAYDANHRLTSTTDPLGKTGTFAYDGKGNLTQTVSPMGKTTTYLYDLKGQLTTVRDAQNGLTSFSYDAFGNVKTITDSSGKTTTLDYDGFGFNRLSRTDPLGRQTAFGYDHNGRVTQITNPDGSTKKITYDACAVTCLEDENGKVSTFEYNGLLSVTRTTDPLGASTGMSYDNNNQIVWLTNALGQTSTMTYDGAGRETRTSNPLGASIDKVYDRNGNLTLLRDENARETLFAYSTNNQLVSVQDPLGYQTTFAWDAAGRLIGKTNPNGSGVAYTYDDDGLLVGKAYSTGESSSYGRDALGNLTVVNDAAGSTRYQYDSLNRVVSILYPDGLSLAFAYDDAGNMTSMTYPGGLVVSYTYDDRNRVASLVWDTGHSLVYRYDGAGNLTKILRSNGTESTYSYDANGRTTNIAHRQGATDLALLDYKRDAVGKTMEEALSLPLPQHLRSPSVAVTYNAMNQIVTRGADTYTYDSHGNLTAIGDGTAFRAVYDAGNRLTSLSRNGVATEYTYNGLGMRMKAVTGTQTRHFYHDAAGRVAFETDGDGTIVGWPIYRGARLAALAKPSGVCHFYHFDKTGNTVAITDGNGQIAAAYAYEPYGLVTNQMGTAINPFTHVGELGVMDEGDGLYFMANRYYDSNTGRFIQKDPVGFAGGTNLYAYVSNNPLDTIDPFGLWGDDVGGIERWSNTARTALPSAHTLVDKTIDVATNVSAGFGDGLTTIPFTNWSFTGWMRGGDDWAVQKDSLLYGGSELAGTAAQSYIGAKAAEAAFNTAKALRNAFNAGEKTVCYTGGGEALGTLAAETSGRTILAETQGGIFLNMIEKKLKDKYQRDLPQMVWDIASALYVSNAKGEVLVYLGKNIQKSSAFFRVEMTILRIMGIPMKFVW